MTREENFISVLALASLVALLIMTVRDNLTSTNTDAYARNNRNYNVIRWQNVFDVASVLPSASAGLDGVPTTGNPLWDNSY